MTAETKAGLKAELRRRTLARRDALAPDVRIERALRAAERGIGHPLLELDPGTVVAGFLPIRSEIDARPLMDGLRVRNCRLCLPVVIGNALVFRELTRTTPLVHAGFGTVGPDEAADVLIPQVLLVPCAAFDRAGHRIGYGAGHYDRALAALDDPLAIGLAFAIQEVERVPAEPHDRPLAAVITDEGVIEIA